MREECVTDSRCACFEPSSQPSQSEKQVLRHVFRLRRYLGRELREPENSEWRAAGVLVYTFDRSGELLMLLGRPDYSGSGLHSQRRNTWNLLGEVAAS